MYSPEGIRSAIAAYRKKTGLSQTRFGVMCGWGQGCQSHYESGKRQLGISELARIIEVLQLHGVVVSADDLLRGILPAVQTTFVCSDDGMSAEPIHMSAGYVVHYVPGDRFESGQIVALNVSGSMVCRVVTRVGPNVLFVPSNPDYKTITMSPEVVMMGVVTKFEVPLRSWRT